MTDRTIRTSASAAREELADALQGLFVAELLAPSQPLWMVTPWISDVPLIDNRTGRFSGLLPDLPQRWIRLSEVLLKHMTRGGTVVIACRPIPHNKSFSGRLERSCAEHGLVPRLRVRLEEDLHEKGVLTKNLLLSGSMNLTFNGLRRLEESIVISADPNRVARTLLDYQDRWGMP